MYGQARWGAKVGKTTILWKADPWLGSSSDQWIWAMESSVEAREEIKMRDEELKIIERSTHHFVLRNKPGAQTFSRWCWIKTILEIWRCSAQSLISPQSPLQWGGHWTHLHRLLNWSRQERISWVMNGRHMLEGSKNVKSWRQGDGWQERRADYLDFIMAVCHCLAQEHLMWPFLEKFQFSQNYAKHWQAHVRKFKECEELEAGR